MLVFETVLLKIFSSNYENKYNFKLASQKTGVQGEKLH